MKLRRSILMAGLLSMVAVLLAVPAATVPRCPTADRVFVGRPINKWPVALLLGDPSVTREVFARLPSGTPAQFYVFIAAPDQPIHLRLTVPVAEHPDSLHLRMALVGPGLPRGQMPMGARPVPGDGVVWSVPMAGSEAARTEVVADGLYVAKQVLDARAPVRGRYVLVIAPGQARDVPYRLAMTGTCDYGVDKVLSAPIAWFEANYFSAPARAIARILLLAAGIAALMGLLYLAWARRGQQQGHFVG